MSSRNVSSGLDGVIPSPAPNPLDSFLEKSVLYNVCRICGNRFKILGPFYVRSKPGSWGPYQEISIGFCPQHFKDHQYVLLWGRILRNPPSNHAKIPDFLCKLLKH